MKRELRSEGNHYTKSGNRLRRGALAIAIFRLRSQNGNAVSEVLSRDAGGGQRDGSSKPSHKL